jgi:type VI secretion system protein ImpL
MSALGWVSLIIGLLLLLIIIGGVVWWLRTQSGAAVRSFYTSVRHMEQEQGAQDRYQIPWLLMLGDETQGTQLCSQWRLQPTDKPAWFGRWWSDPEGAVLVVPQALFLPEEGMNLQRGGWWRLLGLILRLRSKRPLDGVIWTVPVSRLGNVELAASLGLAARRRFIDVLQRFGLSLPVYVVITGMAANARWAGRHRLAPSQPGRRNGAIRRWIRLTVPWRNRSSKSARCQAI